MADYETDPVYLEALHWFALMKEQPVSAEDEQAFQHWYQQTKTHALAYERAHQLWNRFETIVPEYERKKSKQAISRRSLFLALTGAIMVPSSVYMLSQAQLFSDFSTAIAERRKIMLPDGSQMELGSYSTASLSFSNNKRLVTLHRGQAFFQVASDATRPFVVQAGAVTVTALGTQFDIKLDADNTHIAVLEHSVRAANAATAIVLDQGWSVTYGPQGFDVPQRFDAPIIEAWRHDRVIFEDVALKQVLAELERYRRGRIFLMNADIGLIPVTAIFDAREPDEALGFLQNTLPIKIINSGGYFTFVDKK